MAYLKFTKIFGIAVIAMAIAAGFGLSGAVAQNNVMKICGDNWQTAKEAGAEAKGWKWKKFLSECRADLKEGGDGQIYAAQAAKSEAKEKKKKKSTASSAGGSRNVMKMCGELWQRAKDEGAVEKGMTWQSFLKDCRGALAERGVNETASTDSKSSSSSSSSSKSGDRKPTEAQLAMYKRIRKCGQLWQKAKTDGKIPDGMTWPKFWSSCNKRLKK